jgi:hypothetical protein
MAAVNATVSLDELRKFVPKFVNATTLEVGKELLRQAALMVRSSGGGGLLSATAPRGVDEDARTKAERGVKRDIKKVFVLQSSLLSLVANSNNRGARATLKRYLDNRELENAKEFINGTKPTQVKVKGYTAKRYGKTVNVRPYTQTKQASKFNDSRLGRIEHIATTPSAMLHKSRRRTRGRDSGRVFKNQWAQIVTNKPSLNQYIADRQKNVGLLKAGWAKAAKQAYLKVSFPQFVLRNMGKASGSGRSSFSNPSNMYVELANTHPVASSKIEKDDVDFVIQTRQDNIAKELNYKISAVAQKSQWHDPPRTRATLRHANSRPHGQHGPSRHDHPPRRPRVGSRLSLSHHRRHGQRAHRGRGPQLLAGQYGFHGDFRSQRHSGLANHA